MLCMAALTSVLSAVVGLALGAILQYFFSRRLEALRHFQQLRTEAYSEFIAAVAQSANASRRGNKSLQEEALARGTEAKIRILLYGSKSVVRKLGEFSSAQGEVSSKEIAPRFVALIQAMRADARVRPDEIGDHSILASVFPMESLTQTESGPLGGPTLV
jgi:hypothetical protein